MATTGTESRCGSNEYAPMQCLPRPSKLQSSPGVLSLPPSHHTNDGAASCGIAVSKKVELAEGTESHAAHTRSEGCVTGPLKFRPRLMGTVKSSGEVEEIFEVQCIVFGWPPETVALLGS